jgi:hypothetical protein
VYFFMLDLERGEFSRNRVKAALHHPYRRIDFRYELLDKYGRKKTDLYNVLSAEVQHQALATIKRTARFTLRDESEINYLQDRIRPIIKIFIPGILLNVGWAEFPLGEFLLSSPIRYEKDGQILRDVEAYDGLVVLRDDKFEDRYTIKAGTNYISAVVAILASAGISKYNIEQTDKALSKDIEFEIGREKLYAVNEVLRQINYEQIHVDVNGYYVSSYYRSPTDRAAEYDYITDSKSITFGGYSEELDNFDVPNKWVVCRSNPDQEPIRSVYTNANPNSPTSTVNRGRTIVDYRELEEVADQESLNAYIERIAFNASQVYGKVEFETAIMPFHDYADVLNIEFSDLNISGKFLETAWSFPLEVGGKMKHSVRKVVNI